MNQKINSQCNSGCSFFSQRYAVAFFIFLTAFLSRAWFYIAFNHNKAMWADHDLGINDWLGIAKNIAAGAGYSEKSLLTYFPVDHLVPTAARSPLPILILSGLLRLFHNYTYPLLIYSWLLSALTAAGLYFLSGKILGSKKIALAVSLLYCFYLPEMYISSVYAAASESLFTFLLMAYFFAVIYRMEMQSRRLIFWAGLFLGLACLSRPVVLFLPLLFIFWLIKRERMKGLFFAVCFLGVFSFCLIPWAIRNQLVFHKPIVTTTLGGYNLLRHNWGIENNHYALSTAEDFDPFARKVVAEAGFNLKDLNEVQLDNIFRKKARQLIRQYPLRYLKFCVIRAGWLWYKIGAEKTPYSIPNILIYLFMFPGLVLVFIKKHPLRFFALHIFYFVLLHAVINAQFRFICPVMPYGIMIAVYTAALLFQWARTKFTPG